VSGLGRLPPRQCPPRAAIGTGRTRGRSFPQVDGPEAKGGGEQSFQAEITGPWWRTGFCWAPLSAAPQPLHPGVASVLKTGRTKVGRPVSADSEIEPIAPATELEVARLIASGGHPSR
jgi:hypothetical protein